MMKDYYFPEIVLEELVKNNCVNPDKIEKVRSIIQNNIEKFAVVYWTPNDILNLIDACKDEDDHTYDNVNLTDKECFSILREFYYRQVFSEHNWDILKNIIDTYIEH